MQEKLDLLESKKSEARLGGGQDRIDRQHSKKKLTVRERIQLFFDPGTFEEIGMLVEHRSFDFGMEHNKILSDGVITGYGLVNGRSVFAFAQDFTVFGGSLSETHAEKIVKIMELAMQNKAPIVGLNDSGGARIQEGVKSLGGYADIFYRNTLASGFIPQISAIMGPCAGGAVYSPAITDFTIMVDNTSYMFVTGPNVVKTVTNEDVSSEDLGGSTTHSQKSGVSHVRAVSDVECISKVKRLLSYLPQSCHSKPEKLEYKFNDEIIDGLNDIIPANPNQPYDIKEVIHLISDKNSFFEIHEEFAENIVIGFVRIGGRSIGVVANQPMSLAGVLDVNSSRKAGRFVRFCDAFNIPLLVLVDVPGFLPGTDQEWNGIITNGAKLLYAFSEATVPRISVITRKAYGGAYDVMNSKHIGSDLNYSWPSGEIAVMGAKGASEIIFKKEIKDSDNPAEALIEKEKLYADKFANPYSAASRGFIDEVIEPKFTRRKLIKAFAMLENKEVDKIDKKHGNIPL